MERRKIHITAGRGPAECEFLVAEVFSILKYQIKESDLKIVGLTESKGSNKKTLSSVSIEIEGNAPVLNALEIKWSGSIKWRAVSPFRANCRRKNWFISVAFIKSNASNRPWNTNDIRFSAMRSSGPGGQHVNKVATGIRAVHKATGIRVKVTEKRSQQQNKALAIKRIASIIKEKEEHIKAEETHKDWTNHLSLERGNPVKRFKGIPLKEVK